METRISVITNFSPATPAELIDNNANIFPCDTSLGLDTEQRIPSPLSLHFSHREKRSGGRKMTNVEWRGGTNERFPCFPINMYTANIRLRIRLISVVGGAASRVTAVSPIPLEIL